MRPSRRALVVWLFLYAAGMGVAVWATFAARGWVQSQVGDQRGAADWQAWRREVARENAREDAPVRRRLAEGPGSDEPPSLVLLRDHFATVLAFALAIGTLMFAICAFLIHGALFGSGVRVAKAAGEIEHGESPPPLTPSRP